MQERQRERRKRRAYTAADVAEVWERRVALRGGIGAATEFSLGQDR